MHLCSTTYLYVWHAAFICVTWLIRCMTWRIHVCDMTHSCVWHDAFIREIWRIHTFSMTYVYMCDTTLSYVCQTACIRVMLLIHSQQMWHEEAKMFPQYFSHQFGVSVVPHLGQAQWKKTDKFLETYSVTWGGENKDKEGDYAFTTRVNASWHA